MEFFNQSITRMVSIALMDWFSRISIEKYKTISVSGESVYAQRKIIPVPIQWATREKWVEIVRSSAGRKAMDPAMRDLNPVEMQWILPRISCNLSGLTYDAGRRLIKTQQVPDYANSSSNTLGKVYTPAPYTLDFEIATIARHLDDNFQIMEQILPFFAPTMNLSLNLYDSRLTESIPITLTGLTIDNPTDLPEFEERIFTNVYNFQLKINYYMMKKIQNFITNVTINMQNGNEIVKIDMVWLEAQNKMQTKFTEYIANADRMNPLVNINSTSTINYVDSNRISQFENLKELQYISDSLSGLPSPFIHAFIDDSGPSNLVYLTTDAASAYQNNFFIYYRIDDDFTAHKYEGPIEITDSMTRLYCWVDFSTGTTVSQFSNIEILVNGIGFWLVGDDLNPTINDFIIN